MHLPVSDILMRMDKRGYVLTWDSLISLSLVLFMMLGFVGLEYFQTSRYRLNGIIETDLTADNAMQTLAKTGKLEQIGEAYANEDIELARKIASNELDNLELSLTDNFA